MTSSINSLQSENYLIYDEYTGARLMVATFDKYKMISLAENSSSICVFLAVLLRTDTESIFFRRVSALNEAVEIDIGDGFKNDYVWSISLRSG